MPIINFSNPIAILLGVILFVLILFLGKEMKRSWIIGVMLFVLLLLLIGHTIEFATIAQTDPTIHKAVVTSATFDLIFIFISFISYLWIDDIEAKEKKKKSIDNSLDWFWNKI